MSVLTIVFGIVADGSPVDAMSRHFGRSVGFMYYAVGAGAAIALAILWIMINRAYQKRTVPETIHAVEALFDELCRAHRLATRDCRLLLSLAGGKPGAAAGLFVSPSRFAQAGEAHLNANDGESIDAFNAVDQLRRKLFGTTPEKPSTK